MAPRQTITGTVPPTYWIDLDLPPRRRYVDLAKQYADRLRSLTKLFDELVTDLHPKASPEWFRRLARIFLRKLYTREETEEIRGISEAINVEFYLIVALNVSLDLLMGCTSGAARSREEGKNETRMLHFRSLDWGMDPLRQVIVQLKYKRSRSLEPDKALATSITYVGFVGVLTGVREGLSASLNFRPVHNATTKMGHARYYSHLLLVLLGWRRSVSSLLREVLLPTSPSVSHPSLVDIVERIPHQPSTAAYLIFSDGDTTITMEKDSRSAVLRSSSSFIVITNHDVDDAADGSNKATTRNIAGAVTSTLQEFIGDSEERRGLMLKHWQRKMNQTQKNIQKGASDNEPVSKIPATANRGARSTSDRLQSSCTIAPDVDISSTEVRSYQTQAPFTPSSENLVFATQAEIVRWLSKWPTTNETTHFAAVLDPKEGNIAWIRMYLEPVPEPS